MKKTAALHDIAAPAGGVGGVAYRSSSPAAICNNTTTSCGSARDRIARTRVGTCTARSPVERRAGPSCPLLRKCGQRSPSAARWGSACAVGLSVSVAVAIPVSVGVAGELGIVFGQDRPDHRASGEVKPLQRAARGRCGPARRQQRTRWRRRRSIRAARRPVP